MKEYYVTYDQAVKLKKLGFDWECMTFYPKGVKKLCSRIDPCPKPKNWNNTQISDNKFSAPELHQAQAWMRDKGMFLMIYPRYYQGDAVKDVKWSFIIQPLDDIRGQYRSERYGRLFDNYESALSAGIDKALDLLTE